MSGVIYIITTGDECYVGSTFDYKKRLADHKSKICNKTNQKSNAYNMKVYKTIRDNGGEWEISIYDENLSMNDEELQIYEQEVIELLCATLNSKRAHRTYEQMRESQKNGWHKYADNNREKLKQYGRDHYAKNKEAILEKKKEEAKKIVTCECGCIVTKFNIYRHRKSAKHARLMISPELP